MSKSRTITNGPTLCCRWFPALAVALVLSSCGSGSTTCNCVTSDGSPVQIRLAELNVQGLACFDVPEEFPDRGYLRCSTNDSDSIVGPYADLGQAAIPEWIDPDHRWIDLVNLAAGRT